MNPHHNIPVTVAEFRQTYLQARADHPQTPLRLVYNITEARIVEAYGRRKFRNWVVARVAMSQHARRLRMGAAAFGKRRK